GHGEAGAYLQQSMGERQGTPWTGRQSIAGQHRHTGQTTTHTLIHTPKGNLERPINLTGISLDCGSKPEYLSGLVLSSSVSPPLCVLSHCLSP
ncbi:hypothetical protein CHARACLAT_019434, partial [Characodon lateralis]|nr:hypothetical protein [Characodon lateralis]